MSTRHQHAPECRTCDADYVRPVRLPFLGPLAVAGSIVTATFLAVGWQAMEPACETEYRARVGSAATAEGLIEHCANRADTDELSARR